ncbi:MAG: efflux RND transporter periplasmic adaptor subunit [Pseudomonadota bacterium]
MTFTIKGSHILALLITVVIGYWMFGAEIRIGGQNDSGEVTQISENAQTTSGDETKAKKLFRVSVVQINSVVREQTVSVRGRTKAEAVIPVRAETGGVLEKRLVKRGDTVNVGELVCVIDQGARNASLESARARVEQAKGEYEANKKLKDQGFVTDTTMRRMLFDLNAAKAQLKQAEIELSWTEVHAKASGVVQDPIAEVGDVLPIGGTCVTLVDSDPMFFTGQVSERSVNDVKVGMKADVKLITGELVSGTVNYLAPSSDPQTRTFLTEIKLDPQEKLIRDGLTASAEIKLPPEDAIKISPSWLTLEDTGQVGVKIVDDENRVEFLPVQILSQTNQGFWVSGIEEGAKIITLGQEYVISGEVVEPVPDEIQKAELSQ